MCYQTRLIKKKEALQKRFQVDISDLDTFDPALVFKAFDYPKTPIITNSEPHKTSLFNWGLIPSWSKDTSIRPYTLNARIETLSSKPSFKEYIQNRCLIVADGFYEWKWLNASGSKKEKYLISIPEEELFTVAGIYTSWTGLDGAVIQSYSMITTQANDLMSEIHNTKKRMPVILNPADEKNWLDGADYEQFQYPYSQDLIATLLQPDGSQLRFF